MDIPVLLSFLLLFFLLKILLKETLEIKDNLRLNLLFSKLIDFLNAEIDFILFFLKELFLKTMFEDKLFLKYISKSFNEYSNTKLKHPIKTIPKINWDEVIGTNKLAFELQLKKSP